MNAALRNDWGAFVPGTRAHAAPLGRGVLDGLRFAVKDLIDVAGTVTGGGNPDWAATHPPATRHAPAVQRLLEAGATLVGKTVTDELAFSLEGENAHHGTPRNPQAPGRMPGGSSSGSAVAVAAREADFALGTDTGGSVRIPAAFCGVFGFRPTHGRVSLDGVLPFAPSYDTVGWMASTGALLAAVGHVLLGPDPASAPLSLAWAQDVAALCDADVRARLEPQARALGARADACAFGERAAAALQAYGVLQGDEIRRHLGDWITTRHPRFGANIAPRFAALAQITAADVGVAERWREGERRRQHDALQRGVAFVFPTAPCIALPLDASTEQRGRFYQNALAINAIAGHAGLPQVTLPAGEVGGSPIGLSVLGPPGSDLELLALAAAWRTPEPA